MDAITELAKWLPVLAVVKELFDGDHKAAMRELRKMELDQRKARDKRMGR